MEDVMDGVCDRVWVFGKDSFKECPLTSLFTHGTMPVNEGIGCLNSKYQQDQWIHSWIRTYHMYNGLTTAAINLACDGGKDNLPYLHNNVLHDHICSKWVFKCCSPMYEGWFEGFSPIAGVGGACHTLRKGKRSCTWPSWHDNHWRMALRQLTQKYWQWLPVEYLSSKEPDSVMRWIILTWFPWMLTAGLFISWVALTDSTGSSSSNSPPVYSSGSSWSSTALCDDVFQAEKGEHQFLH